MRTGIFLVLALALVCLASCAVARRHHRRSVATETREECIDRVLGSYTRTTVGALGVDSVATGKIYLPRSLCDELYVTRQQVDDLDAVPSSNPSWFGTTQTAANYGGASHFSWAYHVDYRANNCFHALLSPRVIMYSWADSASDLTVLHVAGSELGLTLKQECKLALKQEHRGRAGIDLFDKASQQIIVKILDAAGVAVLAEFGVVKETGKANADMSLCVLHPETALGKGSVFHGVPMGQTNVRDTIDPVYWYGFKQGPNGWSSYNSDVLQVELFAQRIQRLAEKEAQKQEKAQKELEDVEKDF